MNTETKINGALLKEAREKINEALAPLGKELGVTLKAGNASYSGDGISGHFKLAITTLSEGGEMRDMEAEDFLKYCDSLSFKKEDLGREFKMNGSERFTIKGYRRKARKNNLSITRVRDGKHFVVAASRILAHLK